MTARPSLDQPSPFVLKPWSAREAMSISAAATFVGVSEQHMRRLAARFDLGAKLPTMGHGRVNPEKEGAGAWRISRVALRMFAERDDEALSLYLQGIRSDPRVQAYYRREGISCEPVDLAS